MRFHFIPVIIFLVFLVFSSSLWAEAELIQGKEWITLSQDAKADYIFNTIDVLQKRGVPFKKSIKDYISMIDMCVNNDPQLAAAEVKTLFTFVVYKTEPEARQVISKLMNIPENLPQHKQ